MEMPSKHIVRGLAEIIPVLDVLLESPSASDFQRCSTSEITAARDALQWIRRLVYAPKRKDRL